MSNEERFHKEVTFEINFKGYSFLPYREERKRAYQQAHVNVHFFYIDIKWFSMFNSEDLNDWKRKGTEEESQS